MPSYDELKVELEKIANLVEKFPEAIKPKVYDLLIANSLANHNLRKPWLLPSQLHLSQNFSIHQVITLRTLVRLKPIRAKRELGRAIN